MTAPTYQATITPMDGQMNPIPLHGLTLDESYSKGWQAVGIVSKIQTNPVALDFMAKTAMSAGIVPGKPAIVRLFSSARPGAQTMERAWPCVISRLYPMESQHAALLQYQCNLMDPVTYLGDRRIWGTYSSSAGESTLGNVFGGALSLAAGGSGMPSLNPALPGLPSVRIVEKQRAGIGKIPYAIAYGQTLREWLSDILGRLGVRYELCLDDDDGVAVHLLDQIPRAESPALDIGIIGYGDVPSSSEVSETDFLITSIETALVKPRMGTLLAHADHGPPVRVGDKLQGGVETVLEGPVPSLEDAEIRANLAFERADINSMFVVLKSRQPKISPGTMLNLRNVSFRSIQAWQCFSVRHAFVNNTYDNRVMILDGEKIWRPTRPLRKTATILSGVVYSGENNVGERVAKGTPLYYSSRGKTGSGPRNALGRAGVSLIFHPNEAQHDDAADPVGTRLDLQVLMPMAGGVHGHIPQYREGDSCQILVHHPTWAEVIGFGHRESHPIDEWLSESSTGIVFDSQANGDWTGIIIRDEPREAPLKSSMTDSFMANATDLLSNISHEVVTATTHLLLTGAVSKRDDDDDDDDDTTAAADPPVPYNES